MKPKKITPDKLESLEETAALVEPVNPYIRTLWQHIASLIAEIRIVTADRDVARRMASETERAVFEDVADRCVFCRKYPGNGGVCDRNPETYDFYTCGEWYSQQGLEVAATEGEFELKSFIGFRNMLDIRLARSDIFPSEYRHGCIIARQCVYSTQGYGLWGYQISSIGRDNIKLGRLLHDAGSDAFLFCKELPVSCSTAEITSICSILDDINFKHEAWKKEQARNTRYEAWEKARAHNAKYEELEKEQAHE